MRASADESDEAGEFLASSEDASPLEADPDALPDSDLPTPAPLLANVDSLGRMRVPLLAFTATWGRADGLALGKVFEKIVWHGEWLSMIKGRWCVFSLLQTLEILFARLCSGASAVSLESAR